MEKTAIFCIDGLKPIGLGTHILNLATGEHRFSSLGCDNYKLHVYADRVGEKGVRMNTTFAFNFDLTNPTHASAFAQMSVIAANSGIMVAPVGACITPASTPAQVQEPTPAPKTYAPASDVQCVWVQDGTKVSYTLADGKYVGQTGARKTLNARLREAGATYDKDAKVWKFSTKAKAEKFVKDTSALVSAAEIEAVRAKAQARAEKKAQKSA